MLLYVEHKIVSIIFGQLSATAEIFNFHYRVYNNYMQQHKHTQFKCC